uniref:Uncharacterized protein n=1 Tax=Triatoma infestans TaxID=30076 RepID=A0A170U7A2_TRIIF
MKLERKLY